MILDDSVGTNPFFAYSRTDTPDGIGFSVEGFPSENFSDPPPTCWDIKNDIQLAPNYRSNCFVGSLGDCGQLADPALPERERDAARLGQRIAGRVPDDARARRLHLRRPVRRFLRRARDVLDGRCGPRRRSSVSAPSKRRPNGSADFRVAKNFDVPSGGGVAARRPLAGFVASGRRSDASCRDRTYEFIGSTTVTLASPGTLSGFASGWFSKLVGRHGIDVPRRVLPESKRTGSDHSPWFCDDGIGSYDIDRGAFRSRTVREAFPAGTYTVGSCAQNLGVNSINRGVHSAGAVYSGS
jgi:hypothetical protein